MMRLIFLVSLLLSLSHESIAQYLPISNIGDQGETLLSEVVSADFDNDGLNEVVLCDNGQWVLWANLGDNKYEKYLRYHCGYEAIHVSGRAEDMDGDGLTDIILAYIIKRDSAIGLESRVAAGPGPIIQPPPPFYAQGIIEVHRNLGNLEFAPPKRLSQNLGYLAEVEIGNLNDSPELEIIASSLQPESIEDFYLNSGGCVGNYNQHQATMIVLSDHTYSDLNPSIQTLITDSTRHIFNLELSDMDLDGDLDLVLANLPSGKLGIFSNNENLNFVLSDSLTLSEGRLNNMRLLDLNLDGHKDLIYTGQLSNYTGHVSVGLYQNGSFDFPQQRIDSLYSYYSNELNFEDVNQDGFRDYLSTSYTFENWNARLNLQNGSFSSESSIYCKRLAYYILPHVSDNNSQPDLLQFGNAQFGNSNNTKLIYSILNVVPGESPVYNTVCPSEFVYPNAILTADVNQDGMAEILLASNENPVVSAIHLNIEDSLYQKQILVSNIYGARSFTIGDWDLDGDLDMASITNLQSRLVISYNETQEQYVDTLIPNSSYDYSAIVISTDFDQDGFLDIIQYRGQSYNRRFVRLYRNNGSGQFLESEELSDTVNYSSGDVLINDWDEDGFPDLFFLSSSKVVFFKNLNGLGLAAPDTLIFNCGSCTQFQFQDFNQDNLPDLYFRAGSYRHIALLKEQGGIGFTADTLATLTVNPTLVVLDDLNQDQTPDLIMAFNDSLTIKGYLLGDAETGNIELLGNIDRRINRLQTFDFNQDGLKDLYGQYQNGHEIFWLFRDPGAPTPFSKQSPEQDIHVYPNPGQGQFYVISASDNPMEMIEILGMDGRLIKTMKFSPISEMQIDFNASQGMYVIRAHSLKGIKHTTLINTTN